LFWEVDVDLDPDWTELDVAGVGVIVLAVDGHHHVGRSLVPVVTALDIGTSLLLENKIKLIVLTFQLTLLAISLDAS
jgi:hypothetical protein